MTVDVRFDWDDSLNYSLTRRVELRKQKWTIRQRELELAAARNFLKMRLDFVGLYRRHGFGDNLFGNNDTPLYSAWESMFSDSLDDWRIGFELRTPIGTRIGHTAVHHAELQLARENAVYRDQELVISHELSGALAELDRAYTVTRTNYNRKAAAQEQIVAIERKFEVGVTELEFLLDAIRRTTEADSAYYRSLADYSLALANVHFARGSLLSSHGVYLTEGAWTADAYRSASRRAHRFQRRGLPHAHTVPPPISQGAYPQPVAEPTSREDLEGIPPGSTPDSSG
jgi:outer membrane protein TolC